MATPNAARELRAEADIDAPADHVWALLTDFAQMARWSPETVRMVPLKPGGLRVGQWYLGINRRKAVVWPTRSVVADVVPARRLVWDTPSSGAQWVWEIEPVAGDPSRTHVVHRRPVPRHLSLGSRIVAPLLLGGTEAHADELEQGMATTVAGLKAAAEGT
ncbi:MULTISPECIES: SRPBCC family protein [unclassified Nocardioides]|uniref:SRPBCC family protein n=1 Tax=unclassified Nocardioides TaxID=2615069 RepID=UPI00119C9209|nr:MULTISPECIES: SRPBCC family protein [unclassified Nocardioides]